MYVDMLFVNLNKNVETKTTGSTAKVILRRSVIIFTPKAFQRHGTEFVVHILSPLINALLESTKSMYVCIHNLLS